MEWVDDVKSINELNRIIIIHFWAGRASDVSHLSFAAAPATAFALQTRTFIFYSVQDIAAADTCIH